MTTGNPARYVRFLLATMVGLFTLNLMWAIALDPFKVFGIFDFNTRNWEPNTRYLKIEYLKKHEFRGFILGTSRVNGYDVEAATQLTGVPFYNLTADSETPYGMYHKIQWLFERQAVSQIILALDFDEFDQPLKRGEMDLPSQEHPEISKTSRFLFYWKYLWVHPRHHVINIYGNILKKDTWYKYDPATGHYRFPLFDQMMAKSPEKYIEERFQANTRGGTNRIRPNPAHFLYLRKVIDLARDHGVDVKVFINPTNHRKFRRFDTRAYTEWLADVVHIAGQVWDFSGLNSVTTNDRLYYEESHFIFRVGALALKRVFDPENPDLRKYPDFGVLVTPENLGERIATIISNSVSADLSIN